nr:MAG TPA: hypothetical protein [Caudoviricetes sp.]
MNKQIRRGFCDPLLFFDFASPSSINYINEK